MPSHWVEKLEVDGVPCQVWFERSDGAYVWKSRDEKYSFSLSPTCRMWMAYMPPSHTNKYLFKRRRRGLYRIPRKWASAQSAMKALDKECPVNPLPK